MKRFTLIVLVLTATIALAPKPGTCADKAAAKPATATKTTATKTSSKSSSNPAVTDSLGMLERAVAKDSSKWDNLSRLGVMYMDRDRPSDAVKVLTKATKVRPNHVPTIVNLGAAWDAMGKAQTAQSYYREALKLAPADTVANCRLASSLYSVNQYKEAMDLLRNVIAANPRAYCAYFTLGVAFADAGIYREAIKAWKKVVEIAPGSPEAISAKESIDVLERVVQSTP